MPERIQRRMTKDWRKPEGAVYVGRPSRYGNPFRIYGGHSIVGPMWHVGVNTWKHIPTDECIYAYVTSSEPLGSEAAVSLYRDMLAVRQREEPGRFREWMAPLVGRDLMCWCPFQDADGNRIPCHADVLLALSNGGDSRG